MKATVESANAVYTDFSSGEKIRVLHVDNDAEFLAVATHCLEEQGPFQVDTALSAKEALEKLSNADYDAVVADYQMPEKNGLELLKELRQEGITVPFILFTCKGKEEIVIEALNAGVEQYLDKQGNAAATYEELKHSILSAVKRQRTEKRLKESENFLRQITENIQDILVLTDANLRITYASVSVKGILGYEPREIIGKLICQFIHPDDFAGTMEVIKKAFEDHSRGKLEIRCRRADGSYVLVEGAGKILTGENNQVTGAVITFRDVTEHRKMEQQIKASEEKYRKLFEEATDAIFIADFETGILINCNNAAAKLIGRPKSELIGMHQRFLHPEEENEEKFGRVFAQHRADKKGQIVEDHIITKSGEVRDVTIKPALIEINGKKIVQGIFRDITEQKKAEQAISKSEEKYRKLFEEATDAIFIADAKTGILVDCNHAAMELIGREKSEIVGMHQRFLHPEKTRGQFSKTFKQHLTKKEGQVIEAQIISKKGEIRDVAIKANLFEVNGKKMLRGAFRDITEQKKTEEALRKSEEKYRELINGMNDTAWVIGFDGNFIDVNDAAVRIMGYSREELLSMGPPDIDTRLTAEQIRDLIKRMPTDELQVFETAHTTKNGKTIPVEISSSLVSYQGKQAILSIARDITERKQMEKVLKESEERYRKLFEEAIDAIVIADAETGIIVDCNRATTRLVGREKSELIGMHQRFLHPEDPKGKFTESFEQHLGDKEGQVIETQVVTKNGEIRDVAIKASLIEVNGKKMLRGAFRDVTERKKVEEKIKFQARLLNAVGQAIIATDTSGVIIYWNHAAEQLYGWSEAEVLGRNVVDVTPAEASKEHASKILNKLIAGESWSGEFLAKRRDGTPFPAIVTDAPITNDKGELIGIIGISTDITEQKWMQEVFNDAIGKVVELNEKLQVVGSLSRHDIRNKLAAVNGRIFLLKKRLNGNAEALLQLQEMELAAQQMLRILEFERIYEQVGVEELKYIDVEMHLNEAVSLFSDLKGIKLVNECHGLSVLADSLLRQVFYNLLDNSLKYGEKTSKIRVHYAEEVNQLKLIYEDNGVGIPEDEKGNLFKEGFGKGTGYGLYLIKRICEAYGWTIQETGKYGQGVQFTMTIPKKSKDGKRNYEIS